MTSLTWKVNPEFPAFEVSEYGDVRRVATGTRMRGYIDADGYPTYTLRNKDGDRIHISAHRLVALTFIGKPPVDGLEVAHGDGSRLHCHPNNLRWDTTLGNQRDRLEHGTSSRGEGNGRAKITEEQVHRIRSEYREIKRPGSGRKVGELDEAYGLSRSTILDIAFGRSWSHVSSNTKGMD